MNTTLSLPRRKNDPLEDLIIAHLTKINSGTIQSTERDGITGGKLIAITHEKLKSTEDFSKRFKHLRKKGIEILRTGEEYIEYHRQSRQRKTSKIAVAILPTKWSNWRKVAEKFMMPKLDSLFVIDNAMEIIYCADQEICVSADGKIEGEYNNPSFF